MGSRGAFTNSPLAKPATYIHALAARVQEYIYMPNPAGLYVVLGTVIANMMEGRKPVWTMLVGPPSSGKGVLLDALNGIPRIHVTGAFKTPAALISGTSAKERTKKATGGVLIKIGGCGMLVMKDFTSMLDPTGKNGDCLKALREVYDGHYNRPVGTDGGQSLDWFGSIGFLGAVTPVIDRYGAQNVIAELGERWLYYRYDESDGYGETMKAMDNTSAAAAAVRELVAWYVDAMEFKWEEVPARELLAREKNRIFALGALGAVIRSTVPRDRVTQEITDKSFKEIPTRLNLALQQLYLAWELMGLPEDERWPLLCRLAMDSAPQVKTLIVRALRARQVARYKGDPKGGGLTLKDLMSVTECGARVTGNLVVDLQIHGVVEIINKNADGTWRLGEEGAGSLRLGLGSIVRLSKWTIEQMDMGWGRALPGEGEGK